MEKDDQPELLIRFGSKEPDDADPVLATHDRHTVYSIQQFHYTNAARHEMLMLGGGFVALTCIVNPIIIFILSHWLTGLSFQEIMCSLVLIEPGLFLGYFLFKKLKQDFKHFFPEGVAAPTDIGIGNDYLRLHYRSYMFDRMKKPVHWEDVMSIEIEDNKVGGSETPNKVEPFLKIVDRFNRIIKLRIAAIRTIEERRFLLNAFKRKAPRAIVGKDIARLVRIGQIKDIPFTKLWSRQLNSSAGRVNTQPLAPNTLLQDGRLRILDQIGGGGQGAVYSAELLEGGEPPRSVVLKEYVLPDREHIVERKRAVELFEREVWALAQFKHPGIVKLFDAFVEDHRAYLVLEQLPGFSLKKYVSENGPVPESTACELASQMCDILHYLHDFQPPIMHLDFSPENLMLGSNGKVTLIDFNTCSDGTFPKKTVIGKQCYMAPEQYRGKPSTASDIYSLGATLSYLLTGNEPEPISVSRPADASSIDQDLNELVSKLTALEETDRFTNINDVKHELTAIMGKVRARTTTHT